MTNEDWQKLKDWWGTSMYDSFHLQCDEYEITLHNWISKMRIAVMLYVDGWQKVEWFTKGHPIGAKFFQLKKKGIYSAKELKEKQKLFGKKSRHSQQRYYEYLNPSWTSFAAFKKQLLATCKEIKIIEE
ncbi:hypothetical protein FACS1894169_00910 [Bacteroidia bacterium]|nr:hypothetical protein FACS1894169_00910 [Bacteroidia bacterium]